MILLPEMPVFIILSANKDTFLDKACSFFTT
nr:MAG TPA: hypothetical protein [Caudoviricetes sp.]